METQSATGRGDASGSPEDSLAPQVARIAQGDEQALRSLYDALGPRVFGLSFQILRDPSSAEEAVVDVFAQVWRQASRYEPLKGTVTTWVCTLARTRAIDLRRQRARHSTRETSIDVPHFDMFDDPGESPFGVAARGDRAEHVQRALSTLPAEQRRAVEAAFFGGLSHSEIAAAFGQPLGTVKTRIRSALVALRTQLATVEGEVA
ncbi:MAG: sigma-70 family RNA polymerase sigma factor [Planctomycetota bacterium]|nr:sigma-70 family RNA polymerase sigma factor [Planctomycetota bacterium]